MELTKEQILQIDTYVVVCGIKYYDVRAEIVDHFANILEQKLDDNPNLDFKKEIENIHKSFSDKGFSRLLEEKTKSVTKNFYKDSLKHLISFFKLPKIIITVFLFFLLLQIQSFFNETQNFFKCLYYFSIILMFVIIFKASIRSKKEKFLSLSMTLGFYNVYYVFVICLQTGFSRSAESIANSTHNTIYIASYTLLFLFFWSGEYVYQQNKKIVNQQYPQVII